MDKILRYELINNNEQGKIINRKFINNFIEDFKYNNKITTINKVKISRWYDEVGAYNFYTDELLLNLKKMKSMNKDLDKNIYFQTTNTYILLTLIHELTHAFQKSQINNEIKTNESIRKILLLCNDLIVHEPKLYNNYYYNWITEYNAELNALLYIKELLIDNNDSKINSMINKAYKNDALIYKFLKQTNQVMELNLVEISNEERIMYGLPLTVNYKDVKIKTILK